jgi:predicted TIM-barrel fold metal-dependent hydrolase
MLSLYNVENAIEEMTRAKRAGLRGAMIWQVPPSELSFRSDHYDRFWAAAQELDMPVSLHILTGRYTQDPTAMHGLDHYYGAVNLKLQMVSDALFDIIFSGVLERFPALKFVLVENELGWIPFLLDQWDRYGARFAKTDPLTLTMKPSEYYARQVYATFFNDPVGGHLLTWWGVNTSMWSSDYPHPNSTWPNSRQTIARDLGRLSAEDRGKIVRDNVAQLYHLTVPTLVTAGGN